MWYGRRQRINTLFPDLIQLILFLFASTITSWADSNPMYNVYSSWYSQAVTHPSTNQPRHCLTSVIRRELVLSMWYGRRQRKDTLFPDLIQLILFLFASTIISWAYFNPM